MTQQADPARTDERHRFSTAERVVHWVTTVLILICMVTAAVLYIGALAVLVGHRPIVEFLHVYSGLALPVPMLVGIASVAYRVDMGRLNRFSPNDWKWLRSQKYRAHETGVGKFNAGQKLNTALSGGSISVLFFTGCVMYFDSLTSLVYRTGATFVHDWFGIAFSILVIGHMLKAYQDPEARYGMRTGRVSRAWAKRNHPDW